MTMTIRVRVHFGVIVPEGKEFITVGKHGRKQAAVMAAGTKLRAS